MAEAKKTPKTAKTTEKVGKKPVKKAAVVAETVVENDTPEVIMQKEVLETPAEPKATAKAGKHSAKAVREAEEKQAKEARKASAADKPAEVSKKPAPIARSRTERAGKKYQAVAKLVEKDKLYSLAQALELATKTSPAKFDATVELHINLGVDPRQADQNVRDTVSLPAGTGKDIRVATLADDSDAEALFAKLDKEEVDFDVLVATPAMMPKLGKYARLLGPRGLMPNPKSGTVTTDVKTAVEQAKAGRVEYRVDQAGIVHIGIGKVSFGPDKLNQNAEAIMSSIRGNRPASLKGNYLKAITVSTTMGPGIKVELTSRS